MRVPSSTPAGTETDRVRSRCTRPAPPQTLHGFRTVRPLPPQVGQVRSIRKKPCCARTLPAPWQVPQVVAEAAPLSDPEPLHASQDTEDGTFMVFFTPAKASSSPISRLVRRSAPRPEGWRGRRPPPPKRPN